MSADTLFHTIFFSKYLLNEEEKKNEISALRTRKGNQQKQKKTKKKPCK